MTISRFHDCWHAHRPDGILKGIYRELGWEACAVADNPIICRIPPVSLQELAAFQKEKLDIRVVRVVGDLDRMCQCVELLLGGIY